MPEWPGSINTSVCARAVRKHSYTFSQEYLCFFKWCCRCCPITIRGYTSLPFSSSSLSLLATGHVNTCIPVYTQYIRSNIDRLYIHICMWWRSWWSECLSDVGKRERERRTLGLGIARGAPPTMQECLDPRISTTRLLFFCAHKKGSSNFDLLAFFFSILSLGPPLLLAVRSSSIQRLGYYHPCTRIQRAIESHRWWMGFSSPHTFSSEREKERLGTRPVYATSK